MEFLRETITSIQWRSWIREVVILVLMIGALQFILPRSIVSGHSMEPSLYDGQRLAGSPIPYLFGTPQRGDIVMISPIEEDGQNLVKRVIGLPGERVRITGGVVYIDEVRLDEPYLENLCRTCRVGMWTLGENEYFVMGDNRPTSRDSRAYGPITANNIIARVLFRWYPLDEWEIFE